MKSRCSETTGKTISVIGIKTPLFYGAGACALGKLGATVSWIILMATTVLMGNVWGFLSGEWKGSPEKAKNIMYFGLIFLLGSIVSVSLGNYLI